MADIVLDRGKAATWRIRFFLEGQPCNVTGKSITFTVKRKKSDTEADALTVKTLGAGLTLEGGGVSALIAFLPSDTAALPPKLQTFGFDVQVSTSDLDPVITQEGELEVRATYTTVAP